MTIFASTTIISRALRQRRIAFAALLLAGAAHADAGNDAAARIKEGEYLVHAGGCITCHTEDVDDAVPLAGGRALQTPFGTFYTPNITPDREAGIGAWTDADFVRAFHEGESPAGDAYFPAFPYTSYTGITSEDLLAIKAYLFSLPPAANKNREHDLPAYMSSRFAAGIWKGRYFKAGRFVPEAERSAAWNRGAYLVRHLGHCGECHTPRGRFGVLQRDRELAGNAQGPEGESIPNITADPGDGIGKWSADDIEYFLDIGMLPDGDFAGGAMAAVIKDGTSHLTHDDRLAIATYLKSLAPP